MKILADENILFANDAFNEFGSVDTIHGREINNKILKKYDVLLIRSITKVDINLLKDTNIKFIGTATIGTDHIDKEYLKNNKIYFTDAKGCNSFAVAEYVLTAIINLCEFNNWNYEEKSVGIIGYGNIGTIIYEYLKQLGFNVFVNDPPKEKIDKSFNYSILNDVLNCDILTFHVPLEKQGEFPTYHLLNDNNINKIKSGSVIINSSRGAVIDNIALLNRLKQKNDLSVVLDVWENEPNINYELLDYISLGTPHIAGYSYEGKVNGTKILYDKFCEFLNVEKKWNAPLLKEKSELLIQYLYKKEKLFYKIVNEVYDLKIDSDEFINLMKSDEKIIGINFDKLRKDYKLRKEFNNYKIKSSCLKDETIKQLLKLRFNL